MSAFSRRSVVGGLALATLGTPFAPIADPSGAIGEVHFGVFPYLPALKIAKLYSPVATALERLLQQRLVLRTTGTFEEFRDGLLNDAYDIALMHPFLYVDVKAHHNIEPLVRVDQGLQAVILARADYEGFGFKGFRNRVLALPPKLAGVSHLAMNGLVEAGLTPGLDVTVRHFLHKTSCIHAVATGEADGCAIPSFLLTQVNILDCMNLKIVAQSRTVPGLVVATRPHLTHDVCIQIKKEMLGWPATDEGRALLDSLGWPGLVQVATGDYDAVTPYGPLLNEKMAG